MTDIDYRLFMDEICFLEKQKEFSGNFDLTLLLAFRSPRMILESKCRVYNSAIARVFRKYEIANDTLYENLAGIWQSIDQFEPLRKFTIKTVVAFDIILALAMRHIFITYKKRVQKYCANYVKSMSEHQTVVL